MKLSEIAKQLNARLDGADCDITSVAGIEEAQSGQLTFVANPKYAADAKTTKASAVIVAEEFPAVPVATLRIKNPYLAFARAIKLFYRAPKYSSGIHPTAVVSDSATIGKNPSIGPYAVIGDDVEIGDNCVILPHVVIYEGAKIGDNFFAHAHAIVREFCELGDNVILQNGAIVGADGFGFAKDNEGNWEKIMQAGKAILEDDVEIQSNACIDRASVGETRIGRNAKIDNMAHVGHGCTLGEHALLCAQAGLAGSTVVGKNVILGGQVGVAGHCTIGDGVMAVAQSGIPHDVEAGRMVSGAPCIDHRQWLRVSAVWAKLPELAKTIRNLEVRISSIEAK